MKSSRVSLDLLGRIWYIQSRNRILSTTRSDVSHRIRFDMKEYRPAKHLVEVHKWRKSRNKRKGRYITLNPPHGSEDIIGDPDALSIPDIAKACEKVSASGVRNPTLWTQLFNRIRGSRDVIPVNDLVICLNAIDKAGVRNTDLFNLLQREIIDEVNKLEVEEVIDVLTAYSNANCFHSRFFNILRRHIHDKLVIHCAPPTGLDSSVIFINTYSPMSLEQATKLLIACNKIGFYDYSILQHFANALRASQRPTPALLAEGFNEAGLYVEKAERQVKRRLFACDKYEEFLVLRKQYEVARETFRPRLKSETPPEPSMTKEDYKALQAKLQSPEVRKYLSLAAPWVRNRRVEPHRWSFVLLDLLDAAYEPEAFVNLSNLAPYSSGYFGLSAMLKEKNGIFDLEKARQVKMMSSTTPEGEETASESTLLQSEKDLAEQGLIRSAHDMQLQASSHREQFLNMLAFSVQHALDMTRALSSGSLDGHSNFHLDNKDHPFAQNGQLSNKRSYFRTSILPPINSENGGKRRFKRVFSQSTINKKKNLKHPIVVDTSSTLVYSSDGASPPSFVSSGEDPLTLNEDGRVRVLGRYILPLNNSITEEDILTAEKNRKLVIEKYLQRKQHDLVSAHDHEGNEGKWTSLDSFLKQISEGENAHSGGGESDGVDKLHLLESIVDDRRRVKRNLQMKSNTVRYRRIRSDALNASASSTNYAEANSDDSKDILDDDWEISTETKTTTTKQTNPSHDDASSATKSSKKVDIIGDFEVITDDITEPSLSKDNNNSKIQTTISHKRVRKNDNNQDRLEHEDDEDQFATSNSNVTFSRPESVSDLDAFASFNTESPFKPKSQKAVLAKLLARGGMDNLSRDALFTDEVLKIVSDPANADREEFLKLLAKSAGSVFKCWKTDGNQEWSAGMIRFYSALVNAIIETNLRNMPADGLYFTQAIFNDMRKHQEKLAEKQLNWKTVTQKEIKAQLIIEGELMRQDSKNFSVNEKRGSLKYKFLSLRGGDHSK